MNALSRLSVTERDPRVRLPDHRRLPGCAILFNPNTYECTVIYPSGEERTIALSPLFAQLPAPETVAALVEVVSAPCSLEPDDQC